METREFENFKKSAFCFALYAIILISLVFLGLKSSDVSGYAISFEKIDYSTIREMLIGLSVKCFPDFAMLFALCALRNRLSIIASALIMAFRGLVFGRALAFVTVNIVNYNAILQISSYALVTLILLCYSIAVNCGEMKDRAKLLMYFLVSGAVAVADILPEILIS